MQGKKIMKKLQKLTLPFFVTRLTSFVTYTFDSFEETFFRENTTSQGET